MAIMRCDVMSQTMQMTTSCVVVNPVDRLQSSPRKVLYLLHGLSDNCSAWLNNTNIAVLAERYQFCIVMPEVQRSFYMDMKFGLPYYTYVSQELPALCANLFGFSQQREDNYVAGLSMGGYGALKIGMANPDRFAACAGFSSAADLNARAEDDALSRGGEMQAIFGRTTHVLDEENDLFALSSKLSALSAAQQPDIYVTCGTEDFLYNENQKLRRHMEALPLNYTYEEWTGGHEWFFWQESVRRFVEKYMAG